MKGRMLRCDAVGSGSTVPLAGELARHRARPAGLGGLGRAHFACTAGGGPYAPYDSLFWIWR